MTTQMQPPDQIESKTATEPAIAGRWGRPSLGLVALALMAAAGIVGWWIGSSGDLTDSPAIVEQWEDAWLSGDRDAIAAVYAPDATWHDPTSDEVIKGREAIRQNARFTYAWMTFDSFDNREVIVGDGVIIVESTWRGESRSLSSTEMTPFEADVVTVFEVDNELITRSDFFFDLDQVFN